MKTLQETLIFNDSLPFLFIGSGFTKRYLDTPNWEGLLQEFTNIIHPDDPLAYHNYKNQALQTLKATGEDYRSVNKVNSLLADLIEKDFNDLWYNSDQFTDERNASIELIKAGNTPFKIEIANYFKTALKKAHLLTDELEKLKLLSGSSIAGIITTNYDCLLEEYFDFTTYIGQEELLFSSTQNICEIYKIHGCVTSPKSIIINSEDYNKFMERSKYLAAKLLTIFVEHPIVFIGYSITDENVRTIIDNIIDCLSPDQLNTLKSRFIFIERLENPDSGVKLDEVTITSSRKEITMTRISLYDYGILYEILSQNHTKYPVKWLRKLSQNVYNLITTTTPSDKLKILLPFDQLDSNENVEFVVGVGISQAAELAYSSYSAEDIYMDIVFDNKNFNADLLIEKTLPPHLSRTSGSMPFYKYLSKSSCETIPPIFKNYINNHIDNFFNRSIKNTRSCVAGSTITEIATNYDFPKNLYYIVRLPIKAFNKKELLIYLQNLLKRDPESIKTGNQHPHSSDIRRLIKIYDWLEYYEQFLNKKG